MTIISPESFVWALISTFFLLLTCVSATTSLTSSPTVSHQSNDYKFFDYSLPFEQAEQECQIWGGSLVSILSNEESEFVQEMAANNTASTVWIGLSDRVRYSAWVWNNGDSSSYTNWKEGAPSSPLQEHCAVMQLDDGLWEDADCSNSHQFICKRNQGECIWGSRILGAPTPTIHTEILTSGKVSQISEKNSRSLDRLTTGDSEDTMLEISVDVAHKKGVFYGVSFDEKELLDQMCPDVDLIDKSMWSTEKEECSARISLRIPLAQFIAKVNPQLESNAGSDLVLLSSRLYIYYYDTSEAEENACTITRFSTEVSVKTILMVESTTAEMEGENLTDETVFLALTLNEEGRLVIDALLTPNDPSLRFYDFNFISQTDGIMFDLDSKPVNCDQEEGTQDSICRYRLNLISRTAEPNYSGVIRLSFHFTWNGMNETHTAMDFNIEYGVVEEPPSLDSPISADTSLVESDDFSQETDTMNAFTRTYVRTQALTQSLNDMDNVDFRFNNVWICCSKGRENLPMYDPENGEPGCTEYNEQLMSVWKQIVIDGEPSPDMKTQFEELGPLIHNQAVLSFDPFELYGSDRLCYIHSRVAITLDTSQLERDVSQKTVESDSSQVISFRSCSIYNDDQQSCTSEDWCQYNEGTQTCYNDNSDGKSNDSSRSSNVGIACSLVVLVILGLVI